MRGRQATKGKCDDHLLRASCEPIGALAGRSRLLSDHHRVHCRISLPIPPAEVTKASLQFCLLQLADGLVQRDDGPGPHNDRVDRPRITMFVPSRFI